MLSPFVPAGAGSASGGCARYRVLVGPPVQIVCLPHAGGSAASYTKWVRKPYPGLTFVPVELPGRFGRIAEPPLTSMSSLVDLLHHELLPTLTGPYAVFGHSMGAVIAYELVRRLVDTGGPLPRCLVLSGAPTEESPAVRDPAGLDDETLIAWIGSIGGTPAEILDYPGLLGLVLPTLRADLTLLANHGPPRPVALPVPILALAGSDDPVAPPDATAWWESASSRSVRRLVFPGGHFFPHDQPHAIAEAIARAVQ